MSGAFVLLFRSLTYTISPTLVKKRENPWALVLAHTPEMKRRTATEHIRS
jgi:hypothetical protein